MSAADDAYKAAQKLIAEAKTELDLSYDEFQALEILPPEIAELTGLTFLNLRNLKISDITPLSRLTALQRLNLDNTQVAELAPLSDLTALLTLNFNNTKVSELAPLSGLTALQDLRLDNTQVVELAPLSGLTALQTLYLGNTQVEDLRAIAELRSLVDGAERYSHQGLHFANIPALRIDPDGLGRMSEIPDTKHRTPKTLGYLRTLTHWPPRKKPPPPPPPPPDRSHIFLSYSRHDAPRAAQLREALEADGVTIWQDINNISRTPFQQEIDARMEGAEAVLTLWSLFSIKSDYVNAETERGRVQKKLVQATLDPVAPPMPFDRYHAHDLAEWDGDRADRNYQHLLWALRPDLTPGSGIGVVKNTDGTYSPAQQPVAESHHNTNAFERAQAIELQIERVDDLIEDASTTNVHHATILRLTRYLKTLKKSEPLWTQVSEKFDAVSPLLATEQGMDPGMENAVAHFQKGHTDLQQYLDKINAQDFPEDAPKVEPEDAGVAQEELRAASATIRKSEIAPDVADLLDEQAEALEEEQVGPDQFSPEGEGRWRKRIGKIAYVSAGVIGALGAAASTAAFGMSAEGQAVLMQLGEVWAKLMSMMRFGD